MTDVVKRSGDKEVFDIEKIRRSIQKAAIDAGVSLEKINGRIDEISKDVVKMAKMKGDIDTNEIRNSILSKLDSINNSIADSWRRFDRKYKLSN